MATFGTTEKNVVYANLALNAQAVSATSYTAATNTAAATGFNGYANGLLSSAQAAQDVTAFSISVLTNLGLTSAVIGSAAYDALQPALAAYINSVGNANRGVVAVQLAGLVAGLTADATFGAAATNLNNAAASAFAYSTNAANTTAQAIVVATAVAPVTAFTLTTSADTIFGTTGNDSITATDLTYAAATDVIADSSTTDRDLLTVNVVTDDTDLSLTGTIAGIETIAVNVQEFTNASFALDLNGVSGAAVNVDVTQAGSGINTIAVANAGTGTIGLTSKFTTTSVAAKADSNITLNTAGATNAITQTGTADSLTVVGTGATSTTITAAAATDAVSLTTAGEAIVTATAGLSATTGALTVTSAKGALVTATNAKTVTITAAEDADITAAANATTVTVSAAGTNNDTTANVSTLAAAAATTMNLSGNGAHVEFNVVGATSLNTINITGSQDVEVTTSGAVIDGLTDDELTITDSSTGVSMLSIQTAAGNADLTNAAVDVIALEVANATKTLTVASGANVRLAVSQTTSSSTADITAAHATASTNVLNVQINDNATSTGTITLTDQVYSEFATVNFSLTDNLTTAASLHLGTANAVFTGSKALTLAGTTTAASLDASALTGVVTASLAGVASAGTLKTGSAADAITIAAARTSGAFTIETGAGNDTINMIAASANINGGDGTDTVAFAATADLTGKTFALSNVEVVTIAAGATVTVDSAEITGETFVVNGANATTSVFDVTVTEATVDLSKLTVGDALTANVIDGNAFTAIMGATVTGTNAADTITVNGGRASTANGGAGNDTITGGAAADTLNGDAGDDTLVGAGGADTLNGGDGADIIEGGAAADTISTGKGIDAVSGGAGADVINLTESTSAADYVIVQAITDGSAVGAAGGTFTGYDVITGFTHGTDKLVFDADATLDASVTVDTGITDIGDTTVVAMTAATGTANDLTAADFANVDKLVDFFSNGAFTSSADDAVDVVAVTFGTFTAVYLVTDSDGTDGDILAAEIKLIGTVDAVLTTGDIVTA